MKIFIFSFVLFLSTAVIGQEKFLEVNTTAKDSIGSTIKKYVINIVTSEGISFQLEVKKKMKFFLPAGEYYRIDVAKAGFPTKEIRIDLLNVPENRYDRTISFDLKVVLDGENKSQYIYNQRYGQITLDPNAL